MSSGSERRKYEIARAVADLYEAYQFLDEINGLLYPEMFVEIWKKDRAFIEHIENTGKPPRNTINLWFDFYVWSVSWLASRYYYIWDEVLDSWSGSDIRKELRYRANFKSAIQANIEQILGDTHF